MKTRLYISIPIISLLLAYSPVCVAQHKRLCVIGSSTAYGYFPSPSPAYPQDSGWVSKVKEYYRPYNTLDTVFNLGKLGGKDCYSGMPSSYIPPDGENDPDPNSNITKAISMLPKPDVIIINYPSNNYDRLSNAEIIDCFQTMKDSANANGIRCYIATTQPRSSFNYPCRQKLKDLRDTINAVFGVWAIDFFTPLEEEPSLDILPCYDLGDNIHVNPDGHTALARQVIAKNIFVEVLPVSLGNFRVKTVNHSNLLSWSISCCDSKTAFKVQKSNDGKYFETIAIVNASLSKSNYQYSDFLDNSNSHYYRIDAIDKDGKEIFSPVAFIAGINKTLSVSPVFPSPATSFIKTQIVVKGKQKVNITVTNTAGKQLAQQTITVNNSAQYQLNVSRFSAGNYFIQISSGRNKEVLSFSKQ